MNCGLGTKMLTWLLLAVIAAGIFSQCLAETANVSPAEEKAPVELLVCAAASLTDVMPKLADAYLLAAPHVTLTYTLGSSGALQNQIEEGAPADVFLSAGKKQMNALLDKNLILEGSDMDLLENKVVLIVPKDSPLNLVSFEEAGKDKVSLIALGEPDGVPVGQYARQVFKTLGIWDTVSQKANFGSDVRQVLTWVEGGEVDCGVVYATDAMTTDLVAIAATAPEGASDRIIYPAAVIKSSPNRKEAQAFLAFLQTPEAMAIFESFGFSPFLK